MLQQELGQLSLTVFLWCGCCLYLLPHGSKVLYFFIGTSRGVPGARGLWHFPPDFGIFSDTHWHALQMGSKSKPDLICHLLLSLFLLSFPPPLSFSSALELTLGLMNIGKHLPLSYTYLPFNGAWQQTLYPLSRLLSAPPQHPFDIFLFCHSVLISSLDGFKLAVLLPQPPE